MKDTVKVALLMSPRSEKWHVQKTFLLALCGISLRGAIRFEEEEAKDAALKGIYPFSWCGRCLKLLG